MRISREFVFEPTSRYFKVPTHGSPKALFEAYRVHLGCPWHSCLATLIDKPAWQFVFPLRPHNPCWVRPYDARRILISIVSGQVRVTDLCSQTRRCSSKNHRRIWALLLCTGQEVGGEVSRSREGAVNCFLSPRKGVSHHNHIYDSNILHVKWTNYS